MFSRDLLTVHTQLFSLLPYCIVSFHVTLLLFIF